MTRQNSILEANAGNTPPVKQTEARSTRFPGQDVVHGKQRCGSPFDFFSVPKQLHRDQNKQGEENRSLFLFCARSLKK